MNFGQPANKQLEHNVPFTWLVRNHVTWRRLPDIRQDHPISVCHVLHRIPGMMTERKSRIDVSLAPRRGALCSRLISRIAWGACVKVHDMTYYSSGAFKPPNLGARFFVIRDGSAGKLVCRTRFCNYRKSTFVLCVSSFWLTAIPTINVANFYLECHLTAFSSWVLGMGWFAVHLGRNSGTGR